MNTPMQTREANFDGLVGPTHNYGGLSYGNVASSSNSARPSNPKQAVQQGLQKMKSLHDMGMVQGVLAPQSRPDLYTLRRLGFTGSDSQVVRQVAKKTPHYLRLVSLRQACGQPTPPQFHLVQIALMAVYTLPLQT